MSGRRPVVVGSERSEVGLPDAMALLRAGAGALDAVEAALRRCEDNPADHYVGTGGLPNAEGVVELDASVMVGSTRAVGAVAAVRGFPNPISIARAVLEHLPQHCLLVGAGAERFAEDMGFARAELLTAEARLAYLAAMAEGRDDGDAARDAVEGEGTPATGGDERYRRAARALGRRLRPHDGPWGTTNVLALDESGELCVGVSTSGYPWKHPGRVGDSALPGAGNYADARVGGAACTGRGEMAMRVGGARRVVDELARGADPVAACLAMLADAATLADPFAAELRALALTADGRHGGASLTGVATYCVMEATDDAVRVLPRAALTTTG